MVSLLPEACRTVPTFLSSLLALTETQFYYGLLISFWLFALLTAVNLRFRAAPYGRHLQTGWGKEVSATFGWILMEAPASIAPVVFFFLGSRRDTVLRVFLLLWQLHYFHRAFVFPFRRRGGGRMPLVIAVMAIVFNVGNAYLNWRYLTVFGPVYALSWLWDPRFLCGLAVFVFGFAVNQHADWVLLHLRKPGETGYKIPYGGLYRWVSCPNYLGELTEWLGFSLLTWSLGGLTFAVFTAANLLPRAVSHHRDYLRRFPDYPKNRKAVIPFLL